MDEKVMQLMQRVRHIELKTRSLSNNLFAGEYHSAFKGRGMSFAEVREYQPGDDVRDIDWNVSARFDRTYVKTYEEERELTVVLLVDVSPSLNTGTQGQSQRELMTESAATLAFSAIRNNDKIGVLFFSDIIEQYIPPAKGKSHVLRIVRELLTLIPKGKGSDLNAAIEYFMRATRQRSVTFVLSDFEWIPDFQQQLLMARRRHELQAIQVYDRQMAELPNVGLLQLEDAETGLSQVVDTASSKVRKAYAQQWETKCTQLDSTFDRCRIDHVRIATGSDFVKGLKALFARKQRVR